MIERQHHAPATEIDTYGYRYRWTPDSEGKVYTVNFEIVYCIYSAAPGAVLHYGNDIQEAIADFATAPSRIFGGVEWDGCVNWSPTESDTMMHACGLDDIESLVEALKTAWRGAMEIIRVSGVS